MKKLSAAFMALTIFALLFFPSCKSEDVFNIVGTWNGTLTYAGFGTFPVTFTFTGTEAAGTVLVDFPLEGAIGTGTYTVTGLNVIIDMIWGPGDGATFNATGTASADFLSISGSFTQDNGHSGSWTATR